MPYLCYIVVCYDNNNDDNSIIGTAVRYLIRVCYVMLYIRTTLRPDALVLHVGSVMACWLIVNMRYIYIYIHMYMYVFMYVYMYVYVYIDIYTYTSLSLSLRTHIYIYIYIHTRAVHT